MEEDAGGGTDAEETNTEGKAPPGGEGARGSVLELGVARAPEPLLQQQEIHLD